MSMMRRIIRSNWHIDLVEQHLLGVIEGCGLWGELDINHKEYEKIKAKIAFEMGDATKPATLRKMFDKYPIIMVTDMVAFVLFEYDNTDFWPAWASRYGVATNPVLQHDIGTKVMNIFSKHKLAIIEDNGFKYVTPILCQSGIPNISLGKLLNILDSTLHLPSFSVEELVDDLALVRNQRVDVSVHRYVRFHRAHALDLLTNIREMMLIGLPPVSDEEHEVAVFPGLPSRVVEQYREWQLEERKPKNRRSRGERYFASPRLVLDACKGVCILLPEQTIRDEVMSCVCWRISCGESDTYEKKTSRIHDQDGRSFSAEETMPVRPSSQYRIELFDDEDCLRPLTEKWMLDGLDIRNPFMLFNEAGKRFSGDILSAKGNTVLIDVRNTKIVEKHGLQAILELDLPKSWNTVHAYQVFPAEQNASLILQVSGREIRLEIKQPMRANYQMKGLLFNQKPMLYDFPVFVRFPILELEREQSNDWQRLLPNWHMTVIHRGTNSKLHIDTIDQKGTLLPECFIIDLLNVVGDFFSGLFGHYEVRLSDGRNQRTLSFLLSPAVEYTESHMQEELYDLMKYQGEGFRYRCEEGVTLQFTDEVSDIPNPERGGRWRLAQPKSDSLYLRGHVKVEHGGISQQIPFMKAIREVAWHFWNETDNQDEPFGRKRFLNSQLQEEKWRLLVQLRTPEVYGLGIRVVLESANRTILQEYKIMRSDRDGNCVFDLSVFRDTMRIYPKPQRIVLHLMRNREPMEPMEPMEPISLALVTDNTILKHPQYSIKPGKPILFWDPDTDVSGKTIRLDSYSKHGVTVDVPLTEVKRRVPKNQNVVGQNQARVNELVILENVLPDGLYRVEVCEVLEGFFFEEEDKADCVHFEFSRLLCVNGDALRRQLLSKTDAGFSDLLEALIVSLYKEDWFRESVEAVIPKLSCGIARFDCKIVLPLLCTLVSAMEEPSGLSKIARMMVERVCLVIGKDVLNSRNRADILRCLLAGNESDSFIRKMVVTFQLYLLQSDIPLLDKMAMHRLWESTAPVAILAILRGCAEPSAIESVRVASHIGVDSLEQMMVFSRGPDCRDSDWLDCFDNLIFGRCATDCGTLECSKRVWGDCDEWSALIDFHGRHPEARMPIESDTDGYVLMGNNYLELIYSLIVGRKHDNAGAIENDQRQLMSDACQLGDSFVSNARCQFWYDALQKRLGDGSTIQHRFFYYSAVASFLLATRADNSMAQAENRNLYGFLYVAMQISPKLIYRDMVLAELTYRLCH